MSSEGNSVNPRKRGSSNDENFSREVYVRSKMSVDSKFGEETMFDALTLEEPTYPLLSVADAIRKALQHGMAPPPRAPAQRTEMEGDVDMEGVEIEDYDTVKLLQPEIQDYQFKPKPLSAPCIMKLPGSGTEYGRFDSEEGSGPLALMCRINHGHMAQPSLMIRLRKAKNNKGPVKNQEEKTFMEATFTWAPGLDVGTMDDGSMRYQLQDCGAYDLDDYVKEIGVKIPASGASLLSNVDADVRDRLVILRATVNQARIDAEKQARGAFNQNAPQDVQHLVNILWKVPSLTFDVAFLVPKALGLTAEEWLCGHFDPHLGQDLDDRPYPMAPYFKDGDLSIHLDMPSIKYFGNRIFCRWTDKQQHEYLQAAVEDEDSNKFPETYRVPEPMAFSRYEASMTYESKKLFAVPHATTVVREYQWQNGEYRRISAHQIEFQLVRTLKLKSTPVKDNEQRRMKLSAEQIQQETSFYLVGYLPASCPQPLEGSQWLIHWTVLDSDGKQIFEEGRKKWVGYVRHMTTDERRVTRADFLIVAQKPRGAKFIPAVDSFAEVDSKPKKHARIEPVTNKLPALRILDSIKEFVSESRSDLDSLRIPLIFGPEKFKQPSVDLSEGNVPADAEMAKSLYQRAMDVLRPVFNDAQMTIFGQAFRQIENKICLVLGGPGCRKTDTLAYAVCALNLAGHKILLCSEGNPCLDNFMDRLEKVADAKFACATTVEEMISELLALLQPKGYAVAL